MHLLVFRFSAMGDVVLTLPVIRGLLNAYPNLEVTIVTRKVFSPFFANIDRLTVYATDFSGRHKGFAGILKLFYDLNNFGQYDIIIDLHSVLRTHKLCFLYRLKGKKCFVLQKDRSQKKASLKMAGEPDFIHSTERYRNVFLRAGFKFNIQYGCLFENDESSISELEKYLNNKELKHYKFIGIAPFAKHELKIYPEHKLLELIKLLSTEPVEVFFFGGGKTEIEKLKQFASEYDNFHVADISLKLELLLMQKLSVIVTMDSANMHIAVLSGIPVISIWGATHTGMGFGPLNQPTENVIQIPVSDLECRPCTIYGKGFCYRGDFACMNRIDPETIYRRIKHFLG